MSFIVRIGSNAHAYKFMHIQDTDVLYASDYTAIAYATGAEGTIAEK